MQKFLRYLRIAFSATCVVVAVLLVVLWVRSYWWCNGVFRSFPTGYYQANSHRGSLFFMHIGEPMRDVDANWMFTTTPVDKWRRPIKQTPTLYQVLDFHLYKGPARTSVVAPLWFVTLLSAAFAAAPWLTLKRFSLRTLLIATTLIAVGLGTIISLSR